MKKNKMKNFNFTSQDKYTIAEFIYAYQSDTLINIEVLNLIDVLQRHQLISTIVDELKEHFQNKPVNKKNDSIDNYIKNVVSAISVDQDDVILEGLLFCMQTEIGSELITDIMSEYFKGNLSNKK